MNIFIDTNILYQDYFFEKKSNKELMEQCKEGLVNLYMSEIVRLELRRQFQNELHEKNTQIQRIIKSAKRLRVESNINLIDIGSSLKKFDDFYVELQNIENFNVLNYKNEYLPDIVNRAINRIKPFSDTKSELKDALIWKTYSEYVENKEVQECIFLTDNKSDFCNKRNISQVHSDLVSDTDKFEVMPNSFEFIKKYGKYIKVIKSKTIACKFKKHIENEKIDDVRIAEIIAEEFYDDVENSIFSEFDSINPSELFSPDYLFGIEYSIFDCTILNCENIEYSIINDKVLVSGIINGSCGIDIFKYNCVRDSGEDRYNNIGDKIAVFEMYFNFDLEQNEDNDFTASDFEVINVEIIDIS